MESFNGRVRDELLNIEEFATPFEAQVVVEAWRVEYNEYRPHGSLDGLSPPNTPAAGLSTAAPLPQPHPRSSLSGQRRGRFNARCSHNARTNYRDPLRLDPAQELQ